MDVTDTFGCVQGQGLINKLSNIYLCDASDRTLRHRIYYWLCSKVGNEVSDGLVLDP